MLLQLLQPGLSLLCLIPRSRSFVSGHVVRGPFVGDTSSKSIDREGLRESRTGTRQRLLEKVDQLNQTKTVFPNIEHKETNHLSQPETVDPKRKEKIDTVGKREKTDKTTYSKLNLG